MNHLHASTANTACKKEVRWSATRALVVGLVLAFSGAAAWAQITPIPGIDIVVKCPGCTPPYYGKKVSTNDKGEVAFKDLTPGNYDLLVAGQHQKTIQIKATGSIAVVLSEGPGGKTLITINGENGSPLPTSRGINVSVGDVNGDGRLPSAPVNTSRSNKKHPSKAMKSVSPLPDDTQQPGISDQGAAGGLISYGTAPQPKNGDVKSGLAVEGGPIPGVDVKLGKNPGGIVASAKTDANGAFQFTNVPAGNYTLTLPDGLPAKSISISSNGTFGGTVKLNSDGKMSIFDRWGNQLTTSLAAPAPKSTDGKLDTGFGSGNNTMGGGFQGGGASPMSPSGTMGPGAGGPSGGAMGGPGAGRP